MKNAINWFEIPSVSYTRAVRFYGKILGQELINNDTESFKVSMFSYDQKEGVGGSVIFHENIKPAQDGVTVYLNAGDKLDDITKKVEQNGGTIILPKMNIGGDMGFIVQFIDTEGNRIGLHGMK